MARNTLSYISGKDPAYIYSWSEGSTGSESGGEAPKIGAQPAEETRIERCPGAGDRCARTYSTRNACTPPSAVPPVLSGTCVRACGGTAVTYSRAPEKFALRAVVSVGALWGNRKSATVALPGPSPTRKANVELVQLRFRWRRTFADRETLFLGILKRKPPRTSSFGYFRVE